ncbi:hypothetical protein SEA_DARDANUS_72 [Gordonia phage Dardanus]|uniref:Uncharacterized protein n=1 Tax=Gordonia phage Dardanus TaxID=2588489 RepID=A0A514CX81_9CAUD|nr:hypothetical protein KDJ58_gp72 [Gordonia phage Dardanus]QDH85109.1 hypothetical protein SEA_DARDANUS_72 [Gordonia phage Dardanus]
MPSARWHLARAHGRDVNASELHAHGQHEARERFTPKPKRNRRGKTKTEEKTT